MPAPKGNEYYQLRIKSGRSKIFDSPAKFIKACNEYFKWASDNPLMEVQVVKGAQIEFSEMPFENGGEKVKMVSKSIQPYSLVELPKMRVFSIEGLCIFLGIHRDTFYEYEKHEDFSDICSHVRQIIEVQQLEGGAAGFLNANIISRKLGLVDKKDLTSDGQGLNGMLALMKESSIVKTEE